MTKVKGEIDGAEAAEAFARDWQELRADSDIQFAPVDPPEVPETPAWLEAVFQALGQVLGPLAYPLMWVAIAAVVALVLFVLWKVIGPLVLGPFGPRRPRAAAREDSPGWTPDAAEAIALLEDADRLAAEGRYDEATHLLLKRSVGQIAEARPDLLEPSSTAREIAELPALPQAARGAFATIAERVERSLFALRNLSADDWHAARAAYADFALSAPRLA